MLFKINPQAFNAVMACAAVDDARYYLNTFFIDTTNNRMVATNGHVLAYAPVEKVDDGSVGAELDKHMGDLQGSLFQALKRPISNKGEQVIINCAKRLVLFQDGNGKDKETSLEVCDAKYVDYTRVLYNDAHMAIGSITFNAEYVAKPVRWAGFDYCASIFEFNGHRNGMGVQYRDKDKLLSEVRVTLMPAGV